MILCSSLKSKGRFLLWTWEHWEIGGGAGVEWYFLGKPIYPGKWFIGWLFVKEAE